uniref:P-type conjugative transfer protein TrbL n=1 Tax=Geobacter sp. (strain M21) TaxID=443144 RepID=C6DZ86_GEOSM
MDTGILTHLLNQFLGVFSLGYGELLPDARHLLWLLATLEIALAGLWWAFDDGQRIEKALLVKIMQIGFFVWVISNYRWLIDTILYGFIVTGTKAGGATRTDLLQDPSLIVDYGFAATDPIFRHLKDHYLAAGLPDLVLSGLAGVLILLAYFAIAAAAFITYLEFYIISLLGLILVPFGVFKHTSFLAEKVFGAVIAYGIRLMVLAFVLAVVEPTLAQVQLPVSPTLSQIFTVFLAAFTIAVLSWHAPGIASGLMAGSPSLGVGTMMSTGLAAGAGIVGLGAAAGLGSAMSSAKKGLGQVIAASGGEFSHTADKTDGGGGGSMSAGNPPPDKSSGPVSSSGPSPSSSSSSRTPSSSDGSGMPVWAQNLMLAQHAIPQESHPGTGMSAPIRHD